MSPFNHLHPQPWPHFTYIYYQSSQHWVQDTGLSHPIPPALFLLQLKLLLPQDLTLSPISWTPLNAIWWWTRLTTSSTCRTQPLELQSANWHAEDLSKNQVKGGSTMMSVEGISCRSFANEENSSSEGLKNYVIIALFRSRGRGRGGKGPLTQINQGHILEK